MGCWIFTRLSARNKVECHLLYCFFGIYYLARDFYKIRKSGDFKIQNYFRAATIRTVQLAILPIFTYVATWFGWFQSTLGWSRNWGSQNAGIFPNALSSFWHYHSEILYFHTHLTENHSYEAKAWFWLLMYRPTSFSTRPQRDVAPPLVLKF